MGDPMELDPFPTKGRKRKAEDIPSVQQKQKKTQVKKKYLAPANIGPH